MAEQIKKAGSSPAATTTTITIDFWAEARKAVGSGADESLSCNAETPARFDLLACEPAQRLKTEFIDGRATGKLLPSKCVKITFADGSTLKTYPVSPSKDTAFNPEGRSCVAPVQFEVNNKIGHWLALTKR